MQMLRSIFYLAVICQCYSRSIPQEKENIKIENKETGGSPKIKSGAFKIPKAKREVQIHDILHHFKGAVLENHIPGESSLVRKKRGASEDYDAEEEYSSEEEEKCAPRYNLGSSVYHGDVAIGDGGSVVNIGNLYMYQYSPDGEYHRQMPLPGIQFPPFGGKYEKTKPYTYKYTTPSATTPYTEVY